MKKLFYYADKFIKASNWIDLAMIKFCLFSIGSLVGIFAPKKFKKPLVFLCFSLFISTYIPLMIKFFQVVKKNKIS